LGVDTRHAKKLLALTAVGLISATGVGATAATATGVGATAATATGKAGAQPAFWARCSFSIQLSGVEVSRVEVVHLSCAQAKHAIQRAHVLLSPGGPIFSTRGYACRSTNILPRVDPSPIQLPAEELCRQGSRRVAFVWDYSS
jgi:hypothetical protein